MLRSKAKYQVDYHSMVILVTKVVQADGHVMVNTSCCSDVDKETSTSNRPVRRRSNVRVLTHKTLGSLLYSFLTTVRELRLVPREKELLKRGMKAKQTTAVVHQ